MPSPCGRLPVVLLLPAAGVLGAALAGCGCGGPDADPIDAATLDAVVDAAVDAAQPDGGVCGDRSFYTAAIVDWDSDADAFLGVAGATFSNRDHPDEDGTTAPNGRIELCLTRPDQDAVLDLEVDMPGDYVDVDVVVRPPDFILPQNMLAARGFTSARAAAFYDEFGATFDPAKAHLLVYSPVDRDTPNLDVPAEITVAASDDVTPDNFAWAAGDVGRYVLFGNIEPGDATLGATMNPDLSLDLAAGRLTIVNQVVAFE